VSHRQIQSVEISCFVHSTEDEAKIESSVKALLGVDSGPEVEVMEGHFGNKILHLDWHLTGDDAWTAFSNVARGLGEQGRLSLLQQLPGLTDEHGALYLRLKKQSVVAGAPVFSSSDPLRVRVKPRGHLIHGDVQKFYRKFLGEVGSA